MLKLISALNSFLGLLLALVVAAGLGIAGWFGYQNYYAEKWAAQARLAEKEAELHAKQQEVHRLSADVQEKAARIVVLNEDLKVKQKEIDRLQIALKLLKVDHRVAQISVLSQQGSAATDDLTTKFSFVELNENGQPLDNPRVFTVEGDLIYLDAWVVKFSDQYVELGDSLRSTSVCLFRRVFGETQQPSQGFALDQPKSQPVAYRNGGKPTQFEQELWDRFWDYANNPAMAKSAGVRAAHGEAPSIKLVPGKRYRVELRSSGGLSVVPEEEPAGSPPPKL
ncbi:MAG: hypothetical protein HUU20_06585 [Pirellulales bacterium]|nr:hypothetical protein [Pirellulales bacterium]